MAPLFENIKSNPADWIMVTISIISAIVSGIACIYSHKAFQLSKKQHEDTQQQSLMPNLLVKEIPHTTEVNGLENVLIYECHPVHIEPLKAEFSFQITNVGQNIAKNISYKWEHIEKNSMHYVSSLSVSDSRIINICFEANPFGRNIRMPSIIIRYEDMADRLYEQKVRFILDIQKDTIILLNISPDAPQRIKTMEEK